jgi:surface antigen
VAGLRMPFQYRARPSVRLMRGTRVPVTAALMLALASGGCSFQLGSMFDQDEARVRTTASIPSAAASSRAATRAQSDTALRAAASELLTRNDPNASLPWENPQTGARGTVTPIADAYTQAGLTCRDFLASYVQGDSEDWLQGEACRAERGPWEVRSLKPWTRS